MVCCIIGQNGVFVRWLFMRNECCGLMSTLRRVKELLCGYGFAEYCVFCIVLHVLINVCSGWLASYGLFRYGNIWLFIIVLGMEH